MLTVNKKSSVPVADQIAQRMRYLIAKGTFSSTDTLPSTRALAIRIGVSFHTVRKAYHLLESEQLVVSEPGSGFRVLPFAPSSKSMRMESGASLVRELIERLIGIGIDESELEYLIQEQLSLLRTEDSSSLRIVLAGEYKEWAHRCSEQIESALQVEISASVLSNEQNHADADHLIVPFRHIRSVLASGTRADVIGIQTELGASALAAVSRLLERETLGIATQYADAIGPITTELRAQTRFSGQVLGVSVQDGSDHVEPLLAQCNLVLYTTGAKSVLRRILPRLKKHVSLEINVAHSSIESLRDQIPV